MGADNRRGKLECAEEQDFERSSDPELRLFAQICVNSRFKNCDSCAAGRCVESQVETANGREWTRIIAGENQSSRSNEGFPISRHSALWSTTVATLRADSREFAVQKL
jgi:hypothetical protein